MWGRMFEREGCQVTPRVNRTTTSSADPLTCFIFAQPIWGYFQYRIGSSLSVIFTFPHAVIKTSRSLTTAPQGERRKSDCVTILLVSRHQLHEQSNERENGKPSRLCTTDPPRMKQNRLECVHTTARETEGHPGCHSLRSETIFMVRGK
jgi:hypothetical protein